MKSLLTISCGGLLTLGGILALGAATACGSSASADDTPDGGGGNGNGSGGSENSGGASTGGNVGSGGASTGGNVGSGGASTGGNVGSGGASTGGQSGTPDSGDLDAGVEAGDASMDAPPPLVDGAPDADDSGVVTVLFVDFEGPVPDNIDVGGGTLTPSQGYAPLGPPGNTFGDTFLRGPTGNTVTITFNDLPAHTSISIDFLFAAIDSLDGTGSFPAGDFVRIDLDGEQIFRESFANAEVSQIQSYVPPPGVELARRVDLGFSGPGGYHTDSAYDFGADPTFDDIPHTASTAVLTITLEGAGVQDINDESWAIDNLRVLTGHTPRTTDGGADSGP